MAEESNYWSVLHRHLFVAPFLKRRTPVHKHLCTCTLKDLYMEARI